MNAFRRTEISGDLDRRTSESHDGQCRADRHQVARIAALRWSAAVLALLAIFIGPGAARAEFAFPDGSSGVWGWASALIAADGVDNGAISDDAVFDLTPSFFAELAVPNSSHAGVVTYGAAGAGVSATPQSLKLYSYAVGHADIGATPAQGYVEVFTRESAMLDFTGNPDLAGPSFLPLMVSYHLSGNLSASSGAEAGMGFSLISGGYFDTFDYGFSQLVPGTQSISEDISVRIESVPTDNPLIYLATWEVRAIAGTSAVRGVARADFSHTASMTGLTFVNGKTPEELGVTLTFASGGLTAPDLVGPPDFGNPQQVPEPATLTMLCMGGLSMLCCMAARRRRESLGGRAAPNAILASPPPPERA